MALPLVDGVAAIVPPTALAVLRATPGVSVTDDAAVTPQEYEDSQNGATVAAVHRRETRTLDLLAKGVSGRGVVVALVDTGVSTTGAGGDLPDALLASPPHLGTGSAPPVDQRCVNLSGDAGCADGYGHGTFMAGLIAGTGAASGGEYAGHAPGVQLLSLKLAGSDGASDVSKVLAAVQYVVSYRHGADGKPGTPDDLRVLNLSLGSPSRGSWATSPLNLAVQRAWVAGITVVVASGNLGEGEVTKPGDDPLVITVGAVDDRQTGSYTDDRVPSFSGRGAVTWGPRTVGKPDVVAPGALLPSVVPAGSRIDGVSSLARIYGTYRRGSGTSMATAVVSGIAALVLEARRLDLEPGTPDLVKLALTSTARASVGTGDRADVGHGLVDAVGAAATPLGPPPATTQVLSDGSGDLDVDRGGVDVGIEGNRTSQGDADGTNDFYREQYRGTVWSPTTWLESQWVSNPEQLLVVPSEQQAHEWVGNQWVGNQWVGNQWVGNQWVGNQWVGSEWEGGKDTSTSYGTPASGGAWLGAWR